MLPVIVWTPLEQYSAFTMRQCPKCKLNGDMQFRAGWTDGCSTDQPRLLHCVNSNVILVSRIYSCSNNHRVLGHNPDLIRQIPTSLVPFHLWHVAGFTETLINYIDNLCHVGLAMQQIETILAGNWAHMFFNLKEEYLQMRSPTQVVDFPQCEDKSVRFWRLCPTRHSIEACFLHNFWLHENIFNSLMTQSTIPVGQPWMSLDHTFRSVSNIDLQIRSG